MRPNPPLSRRTFRLTLSLILLCLAVPAAAEAGWAPNTPVSGTGSAPEFAKMASLPDGRATVVWERSVGGDLLIQATRIDSEGVAGPVLTLSPTGQDSKSPAVGMGEDGSATVAWTRPAPGNLSIIQTVYISPAGVPGAVADRTEPTEKSYQPGVAVNKGGDATLTWRQVEGSSFSVRSRLIPDSAPVDTIRNLGPCEIVTPDVIALPDGAFRVAWVTGAGATAKVVSRRLTGGVPEPLQDISAIGGNANDPDLEAGSDGRVAVVWSRYVNSRWVTEMNRIDATGAPGTAFQISAGTHDALSPRVGIGPDGTASVAWFASRGNPAVYWIEVARVSTLNVPGGIKKLSADYSSGTGPDISVGGGGNCHGRMD